MATATRISAPAPPPPPTIPDRILVELSIQEAQLLSNVLASIGGSGSKPLSGYHGLYGALTKAGINFEDDYNRKHFKFEPNVGGCGGSLYIT